MSFDERLFGKSSVVEINRVITSWSSIHVSGVVLLLLFESPIN